MNGNNDRHGRSGEGEERLIPKHGGYAHTKTWQLADLIYDVTVRFCERYVDPRSRTHDQMVQAARSGCQNLLEGSVDSATSKKIELKLTGVARGSLAELQRDYQKFLQHRGLPEWPPQHPALLRFKAKRCATLQEFRLWVAEEVRREESARGAGTRTGTRTETRTETPAGTSAGAQTGTPTETRTETPAGTPPGAPAGAPGPDVARPPDVRAGPCPSVSPALTFPAVCAANGALSLLNLCIYLIGRQMEAQADAFEREGGFTERMYRVRQQRRKQP